MPPMLSERAVRGVLGLIVAKLPDELADTKAEHPGDDLFLAAPDFYSDLARGPMTAQVCELEVFEHELQFETTERDMGVVTANARSLRSHTGVTVRLTHANRYNLTPGQMRNRSRRYCAGLVRVLNEFGFDSSELSAYGLQSIVYRSASVDQPSDNYKPTGNGDAGQVVVLCDVFQQESMSGRGTPEGLTFPPSEERLAISLV